jgi:hypothetical protein
MHMPKGGKIYFFVRIEHFLANIYHSPFDSNQVFNIEGAYSVQCTFYIVHCTPNHVQFECSFLPLQAPSRPFCLVC